MTQPVSDIEANPAKLSLNVFIYKMDTHDCLILLEGNLIRFQLTSAKKKRNLRTKVMNFMCLFTLAFLISFTLLLASASSSEEKKVIPTKRCSLICILIKTIMLSCINALQAFMLCVYICFPFSFL